MAAVKSKESKRVARRLRRGNATTVISIALVLCMLGVVCVLLLTTHRMSQHIKENIGISVYLRDNSKEADVLLLQKRLDSEPYVRETRYVSKEEAAEEFMADMGEDFRDFLGYNPLNASIEVRLMADYAHTDSLKAIAEQWSDEPEVKEVVYQRTMIDAINDNIENISAAILAFSVLLVVIAVTLINNTIRLTIYSRRTIIRTMQLVGATRGFIRRPFMWKSVAHGFYGALIAMLILTSVLYYMEEQLQSVISLHEIELLGGLAVSLLLLGIILNVIVTYFAVNKYLRVRPNELYY